jgi:hypothetical protein
VSDFVWTRELARAEAECEGRHERTNSLAHEARDKALFCERRLMVLTGERGGNGTIGRLTSDLLAANAAIAELRDEVSLLKHTKSRAAGALVAVTAIASITATVGAVLAKLLLGG